MGMSVAEWLNSEEGARWSYDYHRQSDGQFTLFCVRFDHYIPEETDDVVVGKGYCHRAYEWSEQERSGRFASDDTSVSLCLQLDNRQCIA